MSNFIDTISQKFKDTESERTVRLICCGIPFDFDILRLNKLFPQNIIKSLIEDCAGISKADDGASILKINVDVQSMRLIYAYYNTMSIIIPESQVERELLLSTCDYFGFVEMSEQIEKILMPEPSDIKIKEETEVKPVVNEIPDSDEFIIIKNDKMIKKCNKKKHDKEIDYTINEKCSLSSLDKKILAMETNLRKEYYMKNNPPIPRVDFINADKTPVMIDHPYTLVNSYNKIDYDWVESNNEFMENLSLYSFGILDNTMPTNLVVAGSAALRCAVKLNILKDIHQFAKELTMYMVHTDDQYSDFTQISSNINPLINCTNEKINFIAQMMTCHCKSLHKKLSMIFTRWRNPKPDNLINYVKNLSKPTVSLSNDIDLFITSEDPDSIKKSIMYVYEKMNKFGLVHILRTKQAITFSVDKSLIPSIQIILRAYDSLEHVLLGFDIDSCCIGFDGKIICSQRFLRAIKYGYNLVDTTRLSTTYELRLMKYYVRGFDIAMTDPSISVQTDKILELIKRHEGIVSFSIFRGIYKLSYLLIQHHKLYSKIKKVTKLSDYSVPNFQIIINQLSNGIEKMDFVYGNNLEDVLFGNVSDMSALNNYRYKRTRNNISKQANIPPLQIMRKNVTKQGDHDDELFTGSFNPIQMKWYEGAIVF